MTLNFPFRNITINELWDFFQKSKVQEHSEIIKNPNSWKKEYFDNSIEIWKEGLVSFENEILQVINTTNQSTIDEYFKQLYDLVVNLHGNLSIDYFREQIYKWNNEIYEKYEEQIDKESDSFFKNKTIERKHLEEYEDYERPPLFLPLQSFLSTNKKIRKINYNYYCVEKIPELIEVKNIEDYFILADDLFQVLINIVKKYFTPWKNGEIISKEEKIIKLKPVIFLEGEHDITYINKAAELLNKSELLDKIELRQREGFRNLDKLWSELKKESWETIPQIKIFLYDCDTQKENEDFGHHYKRIIPTLANGIIKNGIENLFPKTIIDKAIKEKNAYVDFKNESGITRGVKYQKEHCEVNKDEKKNFCAWVCTNATKEDFENFKVIFDIIEDLIE
ncbi:hypothetical protein A0O34_12375 [Chryseobacterium glaciei]|uniref:Uncharacterized protein n=1 Tax=Chryseobacterium glaciei TaxID=1685010 RepID=A0A172XW96_9FLAO|nr:hypothetical protein [Chryseobacterium glaciei]ANF51258.1 hypothetical protein A0O34_12375 [Chryseobacterium glaciei]